MISNVLTGTQNRFTVLSKMSGSIFSFTTQRTLTFTPFFCFASVAAPLVRFWKWDLLNFLLLQHTLENYKQLFVQKLCAEMWTRVSFRKLTA